MAECAGCHYIFAKSDMIRVVERTPGEYVDGRKTTKQNKFGQTTGYFISEGHYTSGKEKSEWYCKACYDRLKPELSSGGGWIDTLLGTGSSRRRENVAEAAVKSVTRSVASSLGRAIVRAILGSLTRR